MSNKKKTKHHDRKSKNDDENDNKKEELPKCDLSNLEGMEDGALCVVKWSEVRGVLHPSQEAIGYAEVKRKIHKSFASKEETAKHVEDTASFPFVVGPGPHHIPYLVDSHHTAAAVEATGYHSTHITLKKICDWNHLKTSLKPDVRTGSSEPSKEDNDGNDESIHYYKDEMSSFYKSMIEHNLMLGIGRPKHDLNILPTPIPIANIRKTIPATIAELKDDPWRSLASMVRHIKDVNFETCPYEQQKCLRGYYRECQEDGTMIPFFEFRWAYYINHAYVQGCSNTTTCWENATQCQQFNDAYQDLMKERPKSIDEQHRKRYKKVAELLLPLLRGKYTQSYKLPESLGIPMGGGHELPGRIYGINTPIRHEDPNCHSPICPAKKQIQIHKNVIHLSLFEGCSIITLSICIVVGISLTTKILRRKRMIGERKRNSSTTSSILSSSPTTGRRAQSQEYLRVATNQNDDHDEYNFGGDTEIELT